ncbi:S8 family serine peptidase [Glycomyces tenuis]|uniref:S8 family serine peptidase n=1 Tax=Glycomyces tenuis TaxID=58116 RepID=UPI00041A2B7B|nr:S8 family serine peptidase [Glycomyces tenuis]
MTERRWRVVLAGAMTLGLAQLAASPVAAETDPAAERLADKAAPSLLAELESEGEAEIWVRFHGAPDYGDALGADTKTEKGAAAVAAAQEFAERSQSEAVDLLAGAGVGYESYWASSSISAVADEALVADLAALDSVAEIHPAVEYPVIEPPEPDTTDASAAAEQWGLDDIRAPEVWEQGFDGTGVVVAGNDSGVDYDHPALVDQYRGDNGDGTFTHDYNFFDAQGVCGGEPCDERGHGTHTMGTMVGDDGAGNRIGVAPGAEWIAVNGCCPDRDTLMAAGQWLAAPTDMAGNDPDPSKAPHIVVNSWGSPYWQDDPWYEDVVAMWHAAGIIPVFSAGNFGYLGCRSTGSPAVYSNVIAVGSHDSTGTIDPDSSRGPNSHGELKPDVTAPGVEILSSEPGGAYGTRSGTSMAAPHVAGMIALMISAEPSLAGDYDEIYRILTGTTVDAEDLSCGGTAEVDNVYGHGRIDAYAAVQSALALN